MTRKRLQQQGNAQPATEQEALGAKPEPPMTPEAQEIADCVDRFDDTKVRGAIREAVFNIASVYERTGASLKPCLAKAAPLRRRSLGEKAALHRILFEVLAQSFEEIDAKTERPGLATAAAELIGAVMACTVDHDRLATPERTKYVAKLRGLALEMRRAAAGGGKGRGSQRKVSIERLLSVAEKVIAGDIEEDGVIGWTGGNPETGRTAKETKKVRADSKAIERERAKMTTHERAAGVLWLMMPQELPEIRELRRVIVSNEGGTGLDKRRVELLSDVREGKKNSFRAGDYSPDELIVRVAHHYGHPDPNTFIKYLDVRAKRGGATT